MNNFTRILSSTCSLGHFIGKYPPFKQLKKWVGPYVLQIIAKKRNENFLLNGLKTLNHLDEILTNAGVSYSLVFGTLLGAVREKGFIKHDLDIDIAIDSTVSDEYIYRILTCGGFKFFRALISDNGKFGREETYIFNGISIDIFYFNKDTNGDYYTIVSVPFDDTPSWDESIKKHGGLMPIQLFLPFASATHRVQFESLMLPIMNNAEEFLIERYGVDWRIPDPTFVYPKMGDARCSYRKDKVVKVINKKDRNV